VAPVGYADLLEQVKVRVRTSRVQAARAVNTELVGLYWQIGPLIIDRQESEGWGSPCLVAGWLLAHDTIRPPIRNMAQHRTVVHLSVCEHNKNNVCRVIPKQAAPARQSMDAVRHQSLAAALPAYQAAGVYALSLRQKTRY